MSAAARVTPCLCVMCGKLYGLHITPGCTAVAVEQWVIVGIGRQRHSQSSFKETTLDSRPRRRERRTERIDLRLEHRTESGAWLSLNQSFFLFLFRDSRTIHSLIFNLSPFLFDTLLISHFLYPVYTQHNPGGESGE